MGPHAFSGEETWGGKYRVLATDDGEEGKVEVGRVLVEVGCGYRATDGGDATIVNVHWQKAGNGDGVGDHPDHILILCVGGDKVRSQGKSTGVVVEADGGGRPAEGHVKIYFGGGKVSAAAGIMQVLREQGAAWHGEQRVRQATGEEFGDGWRPGEGRTPCRDRGFGMLGRRQETPRWADDPVWRIARRRQKGTRVRSRTLPCKDIGRQEGWVGQDGTFSYVKISEGS